MGHFITWASAALSAVEALHPEMKSRGGSQLTESQSCPFHPTSSDSVHLAPQQCLDVLCVHIFEPVTLKPGIRFLNTLEAITVAGFLGVLPVIFSLYRHFCMNVAFLGTLFITAFVSKEMTKMSWRWFQSPLHSSGLWFFFSVTCS